MIYATYKPEKTLVQRAKEIQGWMSDNELAWLNEMSAGKNVMEIGCWKGRSSIAMCSASYLACVDSWRGSKGIEGYPEVINDEVFDIWLANMSDKIYNPAHPYRVNTQKPQQKALLRKLFGGGSDEPIGVMSDFSGLNGDPFERPGILDMVFIDGDHTYDGVISDIELALSLVRTGGIVCGHDFWPNQMDHFKVYEAVSDYFCPKREAGDYSANGYTSKQVFEETLDARRKKDIENLRAVDTIWAVVKGPTGQ